MRAGSRFASIGALLAPLMLVATLAGCSSGDETGGGDADLVVYTGRSEEQIGDLIESFETASGTSVDVRYGDTA
ncbi:MAG: iron ABC transporter substrate-binding protein, partial [Actinomycetes bacterium]